jgi:hypothetical protein
MTLSACGFILFRTIIVFLIIKDKSRGLIWSRYRKMCFALYQSQALPNKIKINFQHFCSGPA